MHERFFVAADGGQIKPSHDVFNVRRSFQRARPRETLPL